ncbi:MAG: hypothetical protein [Bacteriophage sp.]|nr:MAG: hypothetical protein [Bacteriophage sp.]
MSNSELDSLALEYAKYITHIFESDLRGGIGQKQAKVQCLLIDIIGSERRLTERAEVKASTWKQRYRELPGEE